MYKKSDNAHSLFTTNEYEEVKERLKTLLDYELASAMRYRRFASLIIITSQNPEIHLVNLLDDSFRNSDQLFELNQSTLILMGDTDHSGAETALSRIMTQYSTDLALKFAVVSYPKDGNTSTELIDTAYRKIGIDD